MIEISLEYWNKLAEQTIFISALLGGFSITVIASLLTIKESNRIIGNILKAATIAAASFLVTLFAMTQILMITTQGAPMQVNEASFAFPRLVGVLALFAGIVSLMVVIALAGWMKSKTLGRFTTVVGIIAFILIMMMMVEVG